MTDRELLERAAKAAGIEVHRGEKWQSGMLFRAIPRPSSPLVANVEWDPLTDDGDALRLAVALRLQIEWPRTLVAGDENCAVAPRGNGHHGDMEPIGADPAATLRRLIVRAAAALSRAPGATS